MLGGLKLKEKALIVLGPPCSLFIFLSSSNHKRDARYGFGPEGDTSKYNVRLANRIASNAASCQQRCLYTYVQVTRIFNTWMCVKHAAFLCLWEATFIRLLLRSRKPYVVWEQPKGSRMPLLPVVQQIFAALSVTCVLTYMGFYASLLHQFRMYGCVSKS